MKDFIADDDCTVLQRSGLADFEAIWALDLPAVDDLNRGRGGWNEVSRLENDERAYYWQNLYVQTRRAILEARGSLVHRLHEEGLKRGCLYPKHIFLRPNGKCFNACLIDLEKTRLMLFDLSRALVRRAGAWREQDIRTRMAACLKRSADGVALAPWLSRLPARSLNKDARA